MQPPRKSNYEILVIGGSAGSLAMVLKIIPRLTTAMNLAVVLVFHRNQADENLLVDMLAARTTYTVKEAEDKDELRPGVVYVAPPNYHLLVEKNKTLTLDDSEKVNHSRPSIDLTFESAADTYGPALICMLLSGANADGVQGLVSARQYQSLIVVQNPADAAVPFMPQTALDHVPADMLISQDNIEVFLGLVE